MQRSNGKTLVTVYGINNKERLISLTLTSAVLVKIMVQADRRAEKLHKRDESAVATAEKKFKKIRRFVCVAGSNYAAGAAASNNH